MMTLKFLKNYKPTHMTKKYLYTSHFCPGAKVVATYTNGVLSALEGIRNIGILWECIPINAPIPFKEREVEKMARIYDYAVEVQQIELDQTSVKVAMFCAAYKQHTGLKYQVRKADVAKAAEVPMEGKILDLYFTNKEWWGKQPKSLSNYVSNYNNLMQLANQKPARAEDKYPSEPDMEYIKKLTLPEGVKVQQFWYKKGWRPVKSATGEIIKWTAPAKVAMVALVLLFLSSLSGCFILKNQRSSEPEIIITKDTVQVPGDSLQGLVAWEDFWGNDTARVIAENDRQRVEIMPVDTADLDSLEGAGWTWFEPVTHVAPSDDFKPKKRPTTGKVIGVKVTVKPQEIIEDDTTIRQPDNVIVFPGIPADGKPSLGAMITAIISTLVLVFLFFLKRKQDGQDQP